MNVAQLSAVISSHYRQLRWRLTVSYALVALATVLVVEWWGLVGTALFLSRALTLPEVFLLVVRIAWDVVLPTALVLVIPTALVGALIGQIMARWLDGRLERLSKVTRAWQAGDFSQRANDSSGDEITELAGRLNEMAAQFQALLETRQKLAGLEERNRLARELHDSVKQEGLAAIMQLGAARAHLASNPQATAGHLKEADDLVHQMQQELTGLIWELRPVGLDGRSLKVALKLVVENWSRQTHIAARLNETGQIDLPLEFEESLYRIVQEALANVARHSRAAQVEIELNAVPDQVTLVIRDDGIGFDPSEVGQTEFGLRSMRERAAAVGGSLEITSIPGKGTTIATYLPRVPQQATEYELSD